MDTSTRRRTLVSVLVAMVVAWLIVAALYFMRTGRLPIPVPRFERDALAHDLEELTVDGDVLFAYRSATILDGGAEILDRVAELVAAHPDFGIYVDGHADATGEDEYNRALSLRRAEAVVAHLVDRGVTAGRLLARGFGESRPRAPNDTPEGRAANRRVEFTLE